MKTASYRELRAANPVTKKAPKKTAEKTPVETPVEPIIVNGLDATAFGAVWNGDNGTAFQSCITALMSLAQECDQSVLIDLHRNINARLTKLRKTSESVAV
jgi:hypothetical protein